MHGVHSPFKQTDNPLATYYEYHGPNMYVKSYKAQENLNKIGKIIMFKKMVNYPLQNLNICE